MGRRPSVPPLTTFPGNGVTPSQGEPPAPVLSFPPRKQRQPGLANPSYAIPRAQWPDVLRRVEQGESPYRSRLPHLPFNSKLSR